MPAIHYFVRVTVVYLSNNNAQKKLNVNVKRAKNTKTNT